MNEVIPINILNYILKKYKHKSLSEKTLKTISNKSSFKQKEIDLILDEAEINKNNLENDSLLKNLLNNVSLSKIDNIKYSGQENAYDIEVDGNHNYFANEILVSNCVYQEQIMQMAQDLAGYTLGEADILRRAVGKKKKKVIEEQREIFVDKASKLGYEEEKVEKIYNDMILPAAEYSFNKSHAACYAYIAYQGAYLKAYYPAQYNVGVLISQGTKLDRAAIAVEDTITDGIKVQALDVNKSFVEYKYINDKKISLGLKLIKGVGEVELEKVIEEREKNGKYESFDDFLQRNKKTLNKKVLQGLLFSGALDDLIDQNKGIENITRILEFLKKDKKNPSTQVSLFGLFDEAEKGDNTSKFVDLDEPLNKTTPLSKTINEMASTGLLLKNHPLDHIKTYIENFEVNRDTLKWNKNTALLKQDALTIKGMAVIMDVIYKKSETSGKVMANLKLLGTDYYISAMINADLVHKYEYELIGKNKDNPSGIYKMIEFEGKYSVNEYGRSIFISDLKIRDLNQAYKVAEANGQYNINEKCSWEKIINYKNEVLDYKKTASILISEFLLKPENLDIYREKLKELKEFLLRHNSPNGEYSIILKTYDGKVKETGMNISNKDVVINYIEKTSGFKIIGIKKSNQ